MKQTIFLLVLALVICSINMDAQVKKLSKTQNSIKKVNNELRELKVEKHGFEWYKVKKNGKWGAESKDGKVLIPIENDYIGYLGEHFEVYKNKDLAIYSLEGNCIIPFSRHYDCLGSKSIAPKSSKCTVGPHFSFTKGSVIVFCNAEGEEVFHVEGYDMISPEYRNGKFFFEAWIGDSNWVILDGNLNQIFGPAEFFSYEANGDVCTSDNKKLGNLSSISTTVNPFAKNVRRGITYTSPSLGSTSSTSSPGISNSSNSGGTQTIVVEHQHQPVPVQEWHACIGCGGMGTMGCDNCGGGGTKYIGDRLHRCSRCNGRGIIPCNVCYGNKGQYVTVYK